ncbi:P63C domain-containing protein [Lysobacter sp. GX 14042]|uniref:P63C domain-containing protein n=1 Tax=Lysobacter sp. GX 14042 TaxID=2907155 RepID=UPI001F2D73D1|nr:P63C domain-containing protein [Lysobacter sp. GX 14042]MCE7031765.1 P63C domain-containing protein [Lysobacter sp. GX 14042]
MSETKGRARGGKARAAAMTPEQRSESARKAALAKAEMQKLPKATHGSTDHPLKIGHVEISCYVLDDGTRVLSQRGLQSGVGMSTGGGSAGEQRLAVFAQSVADKAIGNKELSVRSAELSERLRTPIRFRVPGQGRPVYGYEATVLADLCDVILEARSGKLLQKQQEHIAAQAEVLVRGFARVGIIALVDEATGYQKDRDKDALAQILEAFVAKELQPYVKTFPSDYYEQLFRLRGLQYPPERASYRPQYFGILTNNIVYDRLAPGVRRELKKEAAKDEKKGKLHQRLTPDMGHPKLREHLASVTAIMKLSKDYDDFIANLNKIHTRYGDTVPLDL